MNDFHEELKKISDLLEQFEKLENIKIIDSTLTFKDIVDIMKNLTGNQQEPSKYYTPSIEEFYIGFEIEWQSQIRKETWNSQICGIDLISIAYNEFEHADEDEPFSEQFRVKYLDIEDIESLGFKFINLTDSYCESYIFENEKMKPVLKIQYVKDNKSFNIIIKNKYVSNPDDFIRFKGVIRNKSELKKLLTQLQIINE